MSTFSGRRTRVSFTPLPTLLTLLQTIIALSVVYMRFLMLRIVAAGGMSGLYCMILFKNCIATAFLCSQVSYLTTIAAQYPQMTMYLMRMTVLAFRKDAICGRMKTRW